MKKKRRKQPSRIWRRPRLAGVAALSLAALSVVVGTTLVFRSLAAVQPVGIPGNWNLVFDDEFNGSSLDTTKWNPGWFGTGLTGPVNSGEDACYSSSNVSESGGVLNLNLVNQSSSCNGHSEPYTGALVYTNGKYSFTYGAVEARIYLPGTTQVNNWPAWWTDGQNWPTDGEMDVIEGLGGDACWHFHDPQGGPGGCAGGNFSGWHTFGANWQPGVVTYYYDGVQVGKISSGITSSPMYLILQNTTSSSSPTATPADMQVDYVRVWSYAGASTPTPTAVHTPTPTVVPHPTPTPTPVPHPGQGTPAPSTASTPTPAPAGGAAAGTPGGTSNSNAGTSTSPAIDFTSTAPSQDKTVTVLGIKMKQTNAFAALVIAVFFILAIVTFRYIQKTRL